MPGPSDPPRNVDLLEGSLGGGEADALRAPLGDRLESLERQHQVRAPLGRGDRVDLVDDDRFDRSERFARLGGEHQVERLGRGDQDVGRLPEQPPPFASVGVARANADRRDVRERHALALSRVLDAGERRAQVLLDVDRERAQGGEVQDPRSMLARGRGCGRQGVEREGPFPACGQQLGLHGMQHRDMCLVVCGDAVAPRRQSLASLLDLTQQGVEALLLGSQNGAGFVARDLQGIDTGHGASKGGGAKGHCPKFLGVGNVRTTLFVF